MADRLPPLNWLRAFEATARHLSFTQAAAELGLSQVAVSKQVKQLEEHLGDRLFIRHPRSLEPTKTADAYLPKVRDAFDKLRDGTREVFGRRRGKALAVRSSIGFSVAWLAPRLPQFRALHPDIDIRITSSIWNEADLRGEFDLDIRYGIGDWPGAVAHQLTWETIQPLCAPHMVERLREPSDLADQDLIHVLGYERGWATWLRAAGLDDIDPGGGVHVDTSLMALEMAASGDGVSISRSSLSQPMVDAGRLVAPFDLKLPIEEAFHLVETSPAIAHPNAEIFKDWLLEQAAA
ncbi:LysR substrate-binding domain-containing protein [Ahrensia sp. R2A130]|uniref:LysR substrate-binding domain-containing protein n=1 Tax=Ahrensia sp. R2A130 TaxID=744979 RepID=UPI00058E14EC|nr:LysR substrate-binding domain-containing protein [Ahrensia sp. R2A130]